jgi:zinc protease
MNIDLQYYTLENGLRVVLHQDSSMPLVCINIAYDIGSKDEPDGMTGFAHLFEHLMFAGSRHVPHGLFDRYCEEAGGYNNAFTNDDKTNYVMMLPAHALALGLWLESDRLLDLDISEENLKVQQDVVMEEKRQRVDNQPYGRYDTKIPGMLFPGHPYGHPVIGSMEDIANASMEAVRNFHDAYYIPNNAVLVIAGDIDYFETSMLVASYFGPIPEGKAPPRIPGHHLDALGEKREIIVDDVPLPGVFIAYRLSEESHADFIPLDVVTEILSSGESSRLYRALVYEQQCASEVVAFVESRQHQGCLIIAAFANPGHTCEELERAIDAELLKLVHTPVEKAELERNLNRIETSFYGNLQLLSSRAERLAHDALFRDNPEYMETMLESYAQVTAETVRMIAAQYLEKNNRVVLHFIPRN